MNFLNYLKELKEHLIELDKTIGFRKTCKYILLVLTVLGILNIKTVTKTCLELINDVQEEIHNDKMLKRDELQAELTPLLFQFRVETGADRILYFEYHNSKENLVGIPFKYIELMLQNSEYGVPTAPLYKDINVGMISELYEEIKSGNNIVCTTWNDSTTRYSRVQDFFEECDGSKQQVFISITGIKQPIGVIVLEWMNENRLCDINLIKRKGGNYVSRINATIMSKR